MIVVTGTKRSGTSLWMKLLIEGGLPHIGQPFPGSWKDSIHAANPNGFHESPLRRGVFFATNPDPRTGSYIPANRSTHHAVKIFIPGVVRSERAYLHRVVATMRHWRTYARSMADLVEQEDAYYAEHPKEGKTAEQTLAEVRRRRGNIPAPIDWFIENYELIRDFTVRRYPINLTSYDRLIEDPDSTIRRVFDWLGAGDPDAATGVVDAGLRRSDDRPAVASEDALSDAHARLFDDFFAAIHDSSSLPKSLVPELNTAWQQLTTQHQRPDSRRVADEQVGQPDDGWETR